MRILLAVSSLFLVSAALAAEPGAPTVGAAMKTLSPAEQQRFQGLTGAAGLNPQQLQGMDIQAAMMAVQSRRAELLETQLKDQRAAVQVRNAEMDRLSEVLGRLRQVAARVPAGKPGDPLGPSDRYPALNALLAELRFQPFGAAGLGATTTKGQLDGAIEQTRARIDSLNNSQQMDMLRLQALNNKRNEAFDTMTNFLKKMQDSRSAIIGNMR